MGERSKFKHLHYFLWHTTYDVLSDGAPVPVALQPPNAVPHLVQHHHQRGKLLADKTCATVMVEGMHVNWTFHRLGPALGGFTEQAAEESSLEGQSVCEGSCLAGEGASVHASRAQEFLHCWIRPEWYF